MDTSSGVEEAVSWFLKISVIPIANWNKDFCLCVIIYSAVLEHQVRVEFFISGLSPPAPSMHFLEL